MRPRFEKLRDPKRAALLQFLEDNKNRFVIGHNFKQLIIEGDEGNGNKGRARHDFDCAARCNPWITCHGIWHIASTIFADPIYISTHYGASSPAAQLCNALYTAFNGRCSFHKQTGAC